LFSYGLLVPARASLATQNARIVGNGQTASWYFLVDGSPCAAENGNAKGNINTK